jgi:hypothetical protein
MTSSIEIYELNNGGASVEVKFEGDTVWLNLNQLSELFGRDKSVISRHLRNIYQDGELNEMATVAKNATVQMEGNRRVKRDLEFYNLDAILSVGYRVNSKQGTHFRIWATQKLNDHRIKGFTANRERLKQLRQSVELIKTTVSSDGIESTQVKDVVQVLSDFALGLDILDGYDHQKLEIGETNLNTQYEIAYSDAKQAILDLKLKFGGSNLFGNEKDQSFRSSIGAINQTFDGKELYPSIEEKAANLLYFVVKNHSFCDGNKRIAAWLFVWYLNKNNYFCIMRWVAKESQIMLWRP